MGNCMNQKKNILIFFGSPRIKGSTAKVVKQLISLGQEHFDFKIINSYKSHIKPCCDCRYCKIHHKCKFRDFDYLNFLIKKSSSFILASPIYNFGFPAPLKLILDRLQPYFYAKKKYSKQDLKKNEKKALLILTSGRKKESSGINAVYLQAKFSLKSINAKISKTMCFDNTDEFSIDFSKKNSTDVLLKSALISLLK